MNNIIISFDFELGWGAVESGRWREREQAGVYESLRPVFRRLITEMDAMEIPATWATVGAMVSDPCMEDFSHLPISAQQNIEQFLNDAAPMTKDGRDLFEILLAAKVPHEIASHSFSHTRFNYPGYDLPSQIEDLKRSLSVIAKKMGQKPSSFVFPQNIAPNFTAVENVGFKSVRISPNNNPYLEKRSLLQKISEDIIYAPPAANETALTTGLKLKSSSLFFHGEGRLPSTVRCHITKMQANRALKRTAKGGGNTHIWLHPFNLVICPKTFNNFKSFIYKIAQQREQQKIKIDLM